MEKPMSASNSRLNRRDFLKLTGGALGLSGLAYYAGFSNQPAPTRSTSADYIDGLSPLPVFRGPYLQQQAQMAAFLLGADLAALTALCDRMLNVPGSAEYKYVPLMANIVVIYADMLISSLDERDAGVGRLRETELGFWVPTLAMRKLGSSYVPQHLAWFLPFLFVDDGCAIASGREVYGFNKQLGQFQKPQDIRDPQFSTSVIGFKAFDPAALAGPEPLLEIKRLDAASNTSTSAWSDWPSARSELSAELVKNTAAGPQGSLVEAAARLVTQPAPLVFLKQFRDAADSRRACYQAIIEAPLDIRQFTAGGFLRPAYQLGISPLASHPLCESLGLPAAQTASLALWMQLDFSLGAGHEVYRAI
jgi:hypothetical protein